MNKFKLFALIIILQLNAIVILKVNAAQLTLPEHINVLKVNGDEYETSLFSKSTKLSLAQGQQNLLLEYSEIFEDADNDDHTKVTSEPFIFTFSVLSTQQQLLVQTLNFADEADAKAFAKKPILVLVDDNNKVQKSHIVFLAELQQQHYQDLMQNQEAIQVNGVATPAIKKEKVITETAQGKKQNSRALDMLYYWWSQATSEEKAAFLKQLKQPRGNK